VAVLLAQQLDDLVADLDEPMSMNGRSS